MIVLCRVDDRLLHGQVTASWSSKVGCDTLVVANDLAATNPMMKMTFQLAKPAGKDLHIVTLDKTIKLLNEQNFLKKTIFVVVETVQDALTLAQSCESLKTINLGGMRQAADQHKKGISKQVYLDDQDLLTINHLAEMGIEVFEQVAVTDAKRNIEDIRRLYK